MMAIRACLRDLISSAEAKPELCVAMKSKSLLRVYQPGTASLNVIHSLQECECLFHAAEEGADDAADDSRFGCLPSFLSGHVLRELMSETRDGQRLQPDAARAGKGGEENAVSAEDHVANAGDAGDLEGHLRLEGADVAGVDAEHFSGREVASDDFAGKLQPGGALPGHALKDESV